jgi:tetratricopeptide (TPR) repeat protein
MTFLKHITFVIATLLSSASVSGQKSKPIFMAINGDLSYFVEISQRYRPSPLATFDINEPVLTAAMLFDALGAYGIKYDSRRDPEKLFSEAVGFDSIYVNPPARVFTSRVAGAEELAVIYAGVLESAGIATAILSDSDRAIVLFNSGVHKRYAGAVSRDVTTYLVRNQQVWLPVDIKLVGVSFHKAWGRITSAETDRIYDIIPVRVLNKSKDIETARVFSSNLARQQFDQLFTADKVFFENPDTRRKWKKVEELQRDDQNRAMIYFNRGLQYSQSGKYDSAIAEFEKSLSLGIEQTQALFFIAKAYGEQRDYESMKQIGRQIIEAHKRDPRGYQILGLACHYAGEQKLSEQLLMRAKFLETHLLTVAKQN